MAHYKGAASEAGRAMQLMKKRELAQQEIELRRKKIENDLKIHNIESKFATHYNAVEQQLKTSTIGLAEKFKQRKQIQALSFSLDEEDEIPMTISEKNSSTLTKTMKTQLSDTQEPQLKKIKKNPDVDTSFLPDREREEEENKLREELRQEWSQKQNALKAEEIEIIFSYWDGSGHRRSVLMKKGDELGILNIIMKGSGFNVCIYTCDASCKCS
ncbi:hypothetical protein QAD02_020367 [Eretmocerus hayati]|uniref:Uncharacterized protein n=1 Tax=Eretmocerus hayati TaxID=131215 RepID=A0ACC2PMB6_9HYME|nr:hypothetical protein QAD02_020367 [Eretmocerus hayati]